MVSIDTEYQKIALSIRQLMANPWDSVADRYPVGSRVKGKVSKLVSFGAFIELKEGVDGLVHISQISNPPIEQVKGFLQIGQEVEARVIKVDRERRRIGLSMIAVGMDESAFSELLRTAQEAEAAS